MINDLDERMARMAMMEGHIDPGHYHLVVSGESLLEVCRNPQAGQPVCMRLESKCLEYGEKLALSEGRQQCEDNCQDQQELRCSQKLYLCRLLLHDSNASSEGNVDRIERKQKCNV